MVFSCSEEKKIEELLQGFMRKKIYLPETLEMVYEHQIKKVAINADYANLVIYFDSTECSKCIINKLFIYDKLYEYEVNSNKFNILMIFSPRDEEYDAVVTELMVADYLYPIYIDYRGEFSKHNTSIPTDRRFHSFLLDKDGHPVFVGNPVSNETMWNLFENALEKEL